MSATITRITRSTTDRRASVDRSGRVSIRPIDGADVSGLSAFYARLSPATCRQRFMGPSHPPTSAQVAILAGSPGVVAVLEERGQRDGEIVGHASLHPDGRGGAEVAFAVADELQGRGIGSRLLDETLEVARSMGMHRISALLYAENARMRRMLIHAGPPVADDEMDAGTEEITLDLDRAA